MFTKSLRALFLACLMISFWGCGEGGGVYGEKITLTTTTPLAEILASPQKFMNQEIRVEGTIDRECSSGCWFVLRDEKGVAILIDLGPTGLAIPPAIGRYAIVQGKVTFYRGYNQPLIIGKGVKIK